MNTVTYGRTVSADYQSQRADVTLDVLDEWTEGDVLQLCKYMVDAFLDIKINRREANRLLRLYTGDVDTDIEEYMSSGEE